MRNGKLPRRCKRCVYAVDVNLGLDCEMLTACVYILRTGQRRPCPAGKDCTVFKKTSRRKGGGGDGEMYGGAGADGV